MTAPQQIEIGHISGSHGLHGALVVHSETRPVTAIGDYKEWWLDRDDKTLHRYQVERSWSQGRKILAKLEGVSNRSDADRLRGLRIFIPLDHIDKEEGSYLWHHLIGCSVTATSGSTLGKVCRIEEYGSSDILIVEDNTKGGEWMVPFTEDIMVHIDLDSKAITVDLPEGMDACFSPRS